MPRYAKLVAKSGVVARAALARAQVRASASCSSHAAPSYPFLRFFIAHRSLDPTCHPISTNRCNLPLPQHRLYFARFLPFCRTAGSPPCTVQSCFVNVSPWVSSSRTLSHQPHASLFDVPCFHGLTGASQHLPTRTLPPSCRIAHVCRHSANQLQPL